MTAISRIEPPLVASPRPRPIRTPPKVGGAALLSLGLHATVIGLAVVLTLYHRPAALVPADTPATVQLVMSPPGGATPPAVPKPKATPSPEAPKPAADTPAPTEPKSTAAASKGSAAQQTLKAPAVAKPAPQATAEAPSPSTASPPPPAPDERPPGDSRLKFDFANIESDTNALVTGDLMVPASPDIKYHNRKPSYPPDAALRGEQGTVVLLIHVSPDGLVSGVDVLRSSGFSELDRAAEDAVETWHFLPSVKDGRAVPDDIPMRIVFAMD